MSFPAAAVKWLLSVGVVCLSLNASAAADDSAKAFYTKGSVEYRLGNFDGALTHFRAAYRLSPRSSLLFNMAQTYRQLKRNQEALFNYKLYLSEWQRNSPTVPVPFRDEVAGRMKELEALIASNKISPATQKSQIASTTPTSAPVTPAPLAPPVVAQSVNSTKPTARRWYKSWWFWTTIGVVVTAATVGTAIGLSKDDGQPPMGTIPPGILQF